MNILLNEVEARGLGSLVEKESTTPDYYPLSLNALINACNQKSNRDPEMHLDEDAVRDALHSLNEKRLAGATSSADSRVTKYEHRLQEVFNFTRPRDGNYVRVGAARPSDAGPAAQALRRFGQPCASQLVRQI